MFDIIYVPHSFHSFHEEVPTTHEHEEDEHTGHSSLHSIIKAPSYHGTFYSNGGNGYGLGNGLITIIMILVGWALLSLIKQHHHKK